VNAPESAKILQVTDTHVAPKGQLIYGIDARARLEACIRDINEHHSDAALCVFTGDLVNVGGDAEYENLREALEFLKVPWRLMAGNHDDRASMRRAFPGVFGRGSYIQDLVEIGDVCLLLLDTLVPGKASGYLCEDRLGWIAKKLREIGGRPTYVFLHHPPLAIGIEYMDGIALTNGSALLSLLAPVKDQIKLVAFGHVHRPVSGLWHGIPFSACPSLVHQVALELGPQVVRHLNFNLEPPTYAIIQTGGDNVVVHQQRYTENWKTFPRAMARGEQATA
jgi:3',5'-cyclic AMP phosphodiesterase CpdA